MATKNLFKIKGQDRVEAFKVQDADGVVTVFIDAVEVTATAAELNLNDNIMSTATVALAAGAANSVDCTITVKDAAGATIAAPHVLEVWISRAATGIGLTSTAASGSLTASTGSIHTALTAKKHVSLITAATGIAVLNLVDTAKTEGEYFCVKIPRSGKVVASSATVTASYG
jgi:hypothetical protein